MTTSAFLLCTPADIHMVRVLPITAITVFTRIMQPGQLPVDLWNVLWNTGDLFEGFSLSNSIFYVTGYLIDPHTAVAKTVADRHSLGSDVPLVISATAHYSKFSDGILSALGLQSETHTNNPVELINKALKLSENPAKHKNLLKDVANSRPHKVVSCPLHTSGIKHAKCTLY